jgi:hypothetical protein
MAVKYPKGAGNLKQRVSPKSEDLIWDMPTVYYKNLPLNVKNYMNKLDTPRNYKSMNSSDITGGVPACQKCDNGIKLQPKDKKKAQWLECTGCNRKKYFGVVV